MRDPAAAGSNDFIVVSTQVVTTACSRVKIPESELSFPQMKSLHDKKLSLPDRRDFRFFCERLFVEFIKGFLLRALQSNAMNHLLASLHFATFGRNSRDPLPVKVWHFHCHYFRWKPV